MDPELLEQSPGRRRHHEHAVGQHDGLANVVRDEEERLAPLRFHPHPLDLVLEDLARLRVERAEGLVAQQDVGVGRERPRQSRALAHARGELVRLGVRPPLEMHVGEPSVRAVSALGRRATCSSSSASSMLPRTESHGNSAGSWNRTARSGPGPVIGAPSSNAWPPLGRSRPASTFRIEVFPQPLGPSRHTNSPGSTSKDTSLAAVIMSPPADRATPSGCATRAWALSGSRAAGVGFEIGHQRSRNFSAISICTTLPSWTTSTTVPNFRRRRISADAREDDLLVVAEVERLEIAPCGAVGRVAHRADATPRGTSGVWSSFTRGPVTQKGRDAVVLASRPPVVWSAAMPNVPDRAAKGQPNACRVLVEPLRCRGWLTDGRLDGIRSGAPRRPSDRAPCRWRPQRTAGTYRFG